ncbi:MAG: peptidoglycan-binding domain-containing protein [Ignavibacteriales bacterium]
MSWFKLKEPMGASYRVNPGDIVNTKTALTQLGYYKPPKGMGIQPWTDEAMFDGIKRFQKDNGLEVDGFMRPGGPTEGRINHHLALAEDGGDGGDDGGDGGGNDGENPENPNPEDPWGSLVPTMCACEASDDNPYRGLA